MLASLLRSGQDLASASTTRDHKRSDEVITEAVSLLHRTWQSFGRRPESSCTKVTETRSDEPWFEVVSPAAELRRKHQQSTESEAPAEASDQEFRGPSVQAAVRLASPIRARSYANVLNAAKDEPTRKLKVLGSTASRTSLASSRTVPGPSGTTKFTRSPLKTRPVAQNEVRAAATLPTSKPAQPVKQASSSPVKSPVKVTRPRSPVFATETRCINRQRRASLPPDWTEPSSRGEATMQPKTTPTIASKRSRADMLQSGTVPPSRTESFAAPTLSSRKRADSKTNSSMSKSSPVRHALPAQTPQWHVVAPKRAGTKPVQPQVKDTPKASSAALSEAGHNGLLPGLSGTTRAPGERTNPPSRIPVPYSQAHMSSPRASHKHIRTSSVPSMTSTAVESNPYACLPQDEAAPSHRNNTQEEAHDHEDSRAAAQQRVASWRSQIAQAEEAKQETQVHTYNYNPQPHRPSSLRAEAPQFVPTMSKRQQVNPAQTWNGESSSEPTPLMPIHTAHALITAGISQPADLQIPSIDGSSTLKPIRMSDGTVVDPAEYISNVKWDMIRKPDQKAIIAQRGYTAHTKPGASSKTISPSGFSPEVTLPGTEYKQPKNGPAVARAVKPKYGRAPAPSSAPSPALPAPLRRHNDGWTIGSARPGWWYGWHGGDGHEISFSGHGTTAEKNPNSPVNVQVGSHTLFRFEGNGSDSSSSTTSPYAGTPDNTGPCSNIVLTHAAEHVGGDSCCGMCSSKRR